jgi:hypothetical protein
LITLAITALFEYLMPENRLTPPAGCNAGAHQSALLERMIALALSLTLLALWMSTHTFKGLGGDAELYAVQALARIHQNLSNDLFLRNTSQDTYTIFSPFYAWCIRLVGLRPAALTLTVAFKLWFFGASWV